MEAWEIFQVVNNLLLCAPQHLYRSGEVSLILGSDYPITNWAWMRQTGIREYRFSLITKAIFSPSEHLYLVKL